MNKQNQTLISTLMTISELAKKLNTKESWIRAACFKKSIPFVKVGRLVRFRIEDIEAWVESNKK